MKRFYLFCLLGLINAWPVIAQIPQQIVEAERSKILAGVKSIPKPGAPGPIAIWGTLAFPILSAPDRDGVELAVAAAAGYGKGRIILFGHNSYLDGAAGGDHATLMDNCLRWVSNKPNPKVALKNVNAEASFTQRGFKSETLRGALEKKTLTGADVLILNMQSVTTPEEGAAVIDFVKNGGGLIAGMTGWAFDQTSGGKDLASSHGVNQALVAAGIAITDMSGFDQVRSFDARSTLPRLLNASDAVTVFKQQGAGAQALAPAEMKQAASAIQIAMTAQPPGRNQLQAAVLAALGTSGAQSAVPTPQSPLKAETDAPQRLRLGMETRVLRIAASDSVAPHPAHEFFPGKVPSSVPKVTRTITVDPAIPGWCSTGLYAPAGATIGVRLPAAWADKGLAVRIGCHSDTLYHLDQWERAPDITRSVALTQAETRAASAFGGLIYIEVPTRTDDSAPLNVDIAGAIAAPLFVLGKDDDAKWVSEIRTRPAPWAELACDKLIITFPSEVARSIASPTQLMEFWKKVVEAQDEITNQAAERRRPERIVADVQISAGYMHSGYPIMIPVSAAPEMVTLSRLKFPGWGFYHEIGHNHQRDHFTFDGTREVTNNVIGMYCYEAVLGKDWLIGHPQISEEARKEHIAQIRAASDKWATWKANPFVALTTYIQLVQAFGWESWRQYLHSFSDTSFGQEPKSDEERRDQFLVRYSKITKKNLAPFFEAWGIPISSSAKSQVSQLEAWMPKDM